LPAGYSATASEPARQQLPIGLHVVDHQNAAGEILLAPFLGRDRLDRMENLVDQAARGRSDACGKMDVFLEEVDISSLLDEVRSIITPLVARNNNRLEFRA